MKNFFTIAVALMASVAMMAQTTVFEWGDMTQSSLPNPTVGTLESVNLDGYAEVKINTNTTKVKGLKCGSSMLNSGAIAKYYKIKPATGGFEAGDTIIYTHVYNNSSEKTTTISIATISDNTIRYTGHQTLNSRNVDGWTTDTCVLAVDADSLALGRVGSTSTFILSIKVIRPADDGVAALKVSPESIALHATASNTNPSAKVTFSGKNLTAGNYALSVPDLAGLTVSPASVTVGEDGKLNAEVTISYTSAVEVAAASTSVDLTIGALTKVVIVNYSATLEKKYMKSINIEQFVLDNGTKADIKAAFDAANIEYQNIDALDTLNDLEDKTNRNYAFLGLKMKKTDAKLAGWLKAGQTIKVRFGNVGANFKVSTMGMDSTCTAANFANTTTESNKVLEFTAPIDMYLEIVCNSTKTLVIKQIMVGQEIAPVELPAPSAYLITIVTDENGKVTATWENKKYRTPVGALVTLNITSNEGYALHNITVNGEALVQSAPGAPITFTMPAEDVTVTADFGDVATAINNTEATVKAVKRIENGQMIIIKNGVKYDALGQIVK